MSHARTNADAEYAKCGRECPAAGHVPGDIADEIVADNVIVTARNVHAIGPVCAGGRVDHALNIISLQHYAAGSRSDRDASDCRRSIRRDRRDVVLGNINARSGNSAGYVDADGSERTRAGIAERRHRITRYGRVYGASREPDARVVFAVHIVEIADEVVADSRSVGTLHVNSDVPDRSRAGVIKFVLRY